MIIITQFENKSNGNLTLNFLVKNSPAVDFVLKFHEKGTHFTAFQ